MACGLVSASEVAPAGEDHGHVVPVGDLDGHLVAHRAAGLDDRRDAAFGGELDGVGEREVRVRREHRQRARGRRRCAARSRRPSAGWPGPAPTPTSAACRASTTALLVTWRTARQANSRSVSSSSVGRRLRHDVQLRAVELRVGRSVSTSRPPSMRWKSRSRDAVVGQAVRRRAGHRQQRSASASGCRIAARRLGVSRAPRPPRRRCRRSASAVSSSTSRLTATTAPNALTGSPSSARR